ncbi:MAG TPA: immunoglobulin domain-containing protein, partial [Verrucomicrobiae bacterium]|nr:immunoglobulin domain-containing protein [Verrucomicrobiae bacterium]
MPLIRSALPTFLNAVRSPMGSLIARWVVGGATYLGYDAISGATTLNYSISISPPTATQGKFYSGTISWSGGYAGETGSMAFNGICLGSYSPSPGLTITYNGGATALMQGTPTASNLFTMTSEINLFTGCPGGYYSATRTTPKFTVISSNGLPAPPSFNNPPPNTVAIVGSPVTLYGGAVGVPAPTYQWERNLVAIAGATNAGYTINNPQFTDAGTYSLMASNSSAHPSSFCVLSVCVPPGTNFTVLNWTNYAVAGVPLTLTSFITNTPTATNTYAWGWDGSPTISTNQNLALTAAQVIPSKSGTYSVFFSSVNGTNVYANQVECDTQWQFGYLPVIPIQPQSATVGEGSNVTFTCELAGGNIPFIYLYQNGTNLIAQTNFPAYNPGSASSTTNISLTISNVRQADAGNYTIVITNFWGSTTSSPVTLTVIPAVSVTSPAGQTNYAGKNVTLSVTATGNPPLSYQWQKGGSNLSNGGNISGATTNVLTIYPAAPSNSGNYQVVVTNNSGSATSTVATVSILPVPTFSLALGANNTTLS